MIKFNHFNFNVFDLQKSLDFYQEALNLTAVREKMLRTVRSSLYISAMAKAILRWS